MTYLFSDEINLKNHAGKKYRRFFWISLAILIPIMILGVATKSLTMKGGITPISSFKAGNNTFELAYVDRDVDKKEVTMQFYVQTNQIDPTDPIQAYVSSSRGGNVKKMPTHLKKINDSYYAVRIENVKPKLKDLFVTLETETDKKAPFNPVSATRISINVPEKNNLTVQSTDNYTNNYLRFMVKSTDKAISNKVKKIEQTNKKISEYRAELKSQEHTLSVQSHSDKSNTESRMKNTKGLISDQQKKVRSYKKSLANLEKSKQYYADKIKE